MLKIRRTHLSGDLVVAAMNYRQRAYLKEGTIVAVVKTEKQGKLAAGLLPAVELNDAVAGKPRPTHQQLMERLGQKIRIAAGVGTAHGLDAG